MLSGLSKEHKAKLDLKDAASYKYLTGVRLQSTIIIPLNQYRTLNLVSILQLNHFEQNVYREGVPCARVETMLPSMLTFDRR